MALVNLPRIKFLLEAVSKLVIQRASVNVEVIEPVNIGKKGQICTITRERVC
ncbi:TPA: hypothetical protein RQK84_004619 [Vibrio vulnificus]|nr:hypothetical protein [Vibrio vulnificus]HDY8016470.1 hypothetical protein [Vibrio vulnificus]